MSGLREQDARASLSTIIYQARVAQPSVGPIFKDFRQELAHRSVGRDRSLYHYAQASELQFVGGWGGNLLAAGHFLVGARAGCRWQALSDAADALERVGYGLLAPLIRLGTWPAHVAAAHAARSTDYARYQFRLIRAAPRLIGRRRRLVLLRLLLARIGNDPYLQGALYLQMALASASIGSSSWTEYIDVAIRNFQFEGRTAEAGDGMRIAAVCAVLAGEDGQARAWLERAKSYQRVHGQRASLVQSRAFGLLLDRSPPLARIVAGAL